MLKHLYIRDFAVIEELDIRFEQGLTVFSGETGAGKSIIVDALGLVLGDRADTTVIRSQCENAEITAIFDITNSPEIEILLNDQDLNHEQELILRRVINRDGRSRAYANSSPVTLQFLQTLAAELVDIHGQHANQSLLKREVQRQLLDQFGQYPILLETVRQHYQDWHEANSALEKLSGNNPDRDAQYSLLQYQVQELEALNPVADEISELDDEHTRLHNANRLLEACQTAINRLSEDNSNITTQLDYINKEITSVLRYDNKLEQVVEMINTASIQLNEAKSELQHYQDHMNIDPERLAQVEQRISAIHDIARKHKIKPEELESQLINLKNELEMLRNSEEHIKDISLKRDSALENFRLACEELNKQRKKTAKKLSAEITEKIRSLGMPGGQFEITVEKGDDNATPRREGLDRIDYMVTVNPGQALHPLAKVASGGELSRISLAIQVIASSDKGIPTLIFDEVDSGIGGGVAEIVGKLLHSLAGMRQVFCVTHLPQVAAQGDHHMQVNKSTLAGTTLTQVVQLNSEERIDEIARMLGGIKITDQSRAHAREMLTSKG